MANVANGSIWYIDSRKSFHVTANKKSFSHLTENDMQFQIELGDDVQYATRGVGTVGFQRELDYPLFSMFQD